jgi:copper chaperone CopZ
MLIKDSLGEAEGVRKAEASHAKGFVKVDFDEARISEDKIRSIIKKEGYEVAK